MANGDENMIYLFNDKLKVYFSGKITKQIVLKKLKKEKLN